MNATMIGLAAGPAHAKKIKDSGSFMYRRRHVFLLAGLVTFTAIGPAAPALCSGFNDPLFDVFAWPPFRPAIRQKKAAQAAEPMPARFQDRPRASCASIACPGVIILGVGF